MAASMGTLPPETIIQILTKITKSSTLLNVALCSRAFYDLTIPTLYSSVELSYDEHDYGTCYPHLPSLTKHLLKNPKLAAHVRELFMRENWTKKAKRSHDKETPNRLNDLSKPTDENILKETIANSNLRKKEQENFTKALKSQNEDAWMALLICTLPNFERLDLMVPALCQEYLAKAFESAAKGSNLFHAGKKAFPSLRVVINNDNDIKYGASPDLLASYLQLPSIREIYLQKIGSSDNDADEGLARLEPGSSFVEHLELRESMINAEDLQNMLSAPRKLKTFVYELDAGHISYCFYDGDAMYKSIGKHAHSLENLWLGGQNMTSKDIAPLGSLSHMQCLKNLKIGMLSLCGVGNNDAVETIPDLASYLPPSIETLYITNEGGGMDIVLKALTSLVLKKCDSIVPKLREISFQSYGDNFGIEEEKIRQLRDIAREVNVLVNSLRSNQLQQKGDSAWAAKVDAIDGEGKGWRAEVLVFVRTAERG